MLAIRVRSVRGLGTKAWGANLTLGWYASVIVYDYGSA